MPVPRPPLETSPPSIMEANPDFGKYQHHLQEFDLTQDQQQELLVTLWQIMTQFVDLGFGRDATTLALKSICGESFDNASPDAGSALYLNKEKDQE